MPDVRSLRPSKIIALHSNYHSRAAERGSTPAVPSYFFKPPSSLSYGGVDLVRPHGCEYMTYEGEIAVVLGKGARRVSVEDARACIGWYTAANDVGVHDLRAVDRGGNVRSKGQDGFTPVGATLLPAAAVDPAALRLRTWVNGRLVQDAGADDMIFGFDRAIADLSRTMTLNPGDIILGGTPTGTGVIVPGDVVEVELAGAGRLVNRVVGDDRPLADIGAMPEISDEQRALAGCPAAELAELPDDGTFPATDLSRRGDGLREQTAAALAEVSTPTLSSQLRKRGINEAFLTGLRPSAPEQRMIGRARTLRYLPLREDAYDRLAPGMNAQKRLVETLGEGDVLVIECRGELGAGTIGDIIAMRAKVRGAAGIVTDGCLRDSPSFPSLGIPTYSAGAHAAVLGRRHVPYDSGQAVSCGGVLVEPGDVLVGDGDGVIVIPADLVDEVAADARVQERQEAYMLERVRAGASLDGLYPMNAATRAAYEEYLKGQRQ